MKKSNAFPWRNWYLLVFLFLFAIPDATILIMGKIEGKPVSLINYSLNADARIDESLMYVNMLNRFNSFGDVGKDTYLKGGEFHNLTRPILPLFIAKAFYFISGKNIDVTILLLHTVIPFATTVLIFFVLTTLFGMSPVASFFLLFVIVFEWLTSLFNLMEKMHLLNHLVRHSINEDSFQNGFVPYFSRFFSPGLTLIFFWGALYAFWKSFFAKGYKWAVTAGILFSLNLYAYPHQVYVLTFIYLMAFITPKARLTHFLAFSSTAFVVGLPFVLSAIVLKEHATGPDILARVGFASVWYFRTYQVSLSFLCFGLLWLHVKATKSDFRKFSETGTQFYFSTLLFGTIQALIMLFLVESRRFLPQPWLVADRVTAYTIPIVLWYSITALKGLDLNFKELQRWAAPVIGVFVAIGAFVQFQSSRVHFEGFVVPKERQEFVNAMNALPAGQVVLTNDYLQNAVLACETNQWNFIAYCINSNAATDECYARLVVANLIFGVPSETFFEEKFVWRTGIPRGEHWVFHHQADNLGLTKDRVKGLYEAIEKVKPEEILSRFPVDFVYGERVGKRFEKFFKKIGPNVYQKTWSNPISISKRPASK